jgi:hypothetical protein
MRLRVPAVPVAVLLVGLLYLIPFQFARADSLSTSAQVAGVYPGQSCFQTDTNTASCTAGASNQFVAPFSDTYFFGGSADAIASYGSLGTSASALDQCNVTSAIVTCLFMGQRATAGAAFDDGITITNAPASGVLDFTLSTSGTGSVICTGPDLTICSNSSAATVLNTATTEILDGGQQSTSLPNGVSFHTLAIPFISSNGSAFVDLSLGLTSFVSCSADNTTDCNATTNFIDTAQITGVQVLDGNGSVDPNALLSSQSGTNYNSLVGTTSTPEPSTLSLLAVALIALVGASKLKLVVF